MNHQTDTYKLSNGVGIPCIFHAVTGLNCPGCGVSRMGIALLHLDLRAAFLYNRCILILSPVIAVLLFRTAYLYVSGKKKGSLEAKLEKYTGLALIVILLAWGVNRLFTRPVARLLSRS